MAGEISVYGVDTCEDTLRTRAHLNQLGINYRYINLDKDESASRKVQEWNHGKRITPTVIIAGNGRTARLAEPSNDELDAALESAGLRAA